jgi:hypothetical protein
MFLVSIFERHSNRVSIRVRRSNCCRVSKFVLREPRLARFPCVLPCSRPLVLPYVRTLELRGPSLTLASRIGRHHHWPEFYFFFTFFFPLFFYNNIWFIFFCKTILLALWGTETFWTRMEVNFIWSHLHSRIIDILCASPEKKHRFGPISREANRTFSICFSGHTGPCDSHHTPEDIYTLQIGTPPSLTFFSPPSRSLPNRFLPGDGRASCAARQSFIGRLALRRRRESDRGLHAHHSLPSRSAARNWSPKPLAYGICIRIWPWFHLLNSILHATIAGVYMCTPMSSTGSALWRL